jgi:hypothetical protein
MQLIVRMGLAKTVPAACARRKTTTTGLVLPKVNLERQGRPARLSMYACRCGSWGGSDIAWIQLIETATGAVFLGSSCSWVGDSLCDR